MDNQDNTGAAAGTVETRPSFVSDVIGGAEKVVQYGEDLIHAGASAVETAVAGATSFAGDPVVAIARLGGVHYELSHIGLSSDLRDALEEVEKAIVSLARHIAGA